MRLFLQQHKKLILLYLGNFVGLTTLFFYLDGLSNPMQLGYFVLLSCFFLVTYLATQYTREKELYNWLSISENDLTPDQLGTTPLAKASGKAMKQKDNKHIEALNLAQHQYAQYLQFINRWVHHIKTPLSVLQLIYKEHEDKDVIHDIQTETDRILQGLNMALYYARAEDMTNDLHFTFLNLANTVKEVVHDLKRWFIRSEVFPQVKIDPEFPLSSDIKWLKFIISQLLTNAIKYADKKDAQVSIELKNGCLLIRDNGMGIPLKDQSRVFDQFFTGENGRLKGESTGIGLYLVYQICTKLNYPLSLESRQGVETIIKIQLN